MTSCNSRRMTFDRRSCLISLAGAGLSFLLPPLSMRAAGQRGTERASSLVTVWLQGGASQLETWDPHPDTTNGGPTQAIATAVLGLKIAEFYPQTAEVMASFSVIRSLVSKEGDHERGTYHLKTGYRPDPSVRHPSLGSMLACVSRPKGLELPPHVALDGGPWPPRGGYLGDEFDAFRVLDPGGQLTNVAPRVGRDRQDRRLAGLDVLERSFRSDRPRAAEQTRHEDATREAVRLMDSDQLKAFEIHDEPAAVKAAYGDNRFGKSCLVARRLIEAGVRAVEVTLDGFDSHTDNFTTHRNKAAVLDPALATLMNDLRTRDLLASTVVLVLTEFGRTPKINPLEGRDHWPGGFSCLLGGGDIQPGRIVGSTDPAGTADPVRPVPVADLFATVLAALKVDPAIEHFSPIGRPFKRAEGTPVAELLA